jgi:hypothetical protein
MKNKITTLIDTILTESALDPRIESGIFDIHNIEHMQIMAEHMTAQGIDAAIISEVINELVVDEGKYPERQAYNKDGWLVTFPSAEYKQRAIKKGTHYGSDPTHGKGGMHLYYKGKGKQKRQTQQTVTSTGTEKPVQNVPVTPTTQPNAVTNPEIVPTASDKSTEPKKKANKPATTEPEEYTDDYTSADDAADEEKAAQAFGDFWAKNKQPVAQPVSTQQVPPAPQSIAAPAIPAIPIAPDFTKPSKKFALDKGWKSTPYGEWRDRLGNTVAVTGLSGEVVPLKNTDREELKIASEKNTAV